MRPGLLPVVGVALQAWQGRQDAHPLYLAACRIEEPDGAGEHLSLLHPRERACLEGLRHARRRHSYLLGRVAAKLALMGLAREVDPRDIWIDNGVFLQPVVRARTPVHLEVSITHCDSLGSAIAFPAACPAGIDIESVNPEKCQVLLTQTTAGERRLLSRLGLKEEEGLCLLWTAKEALSKALRTGLTVSAEALEVGELFRQGATFICSFRCFPQYRAASFLAGGYFVSIVLPRPVQLGVNWVDVQHRIGALVRSSATGAGI